MKVDRENKYIDLSLKKSIVSSKKRLTFEDIKENDVIDGTVKRVETFGIFITIKRSSLTGLCHKSQVGNE
jgi:rRNA biogenesis protein RRP5